MRRRGGPKKKNCLCPLFSKWMKPAFTADHWPVQAIFKYNQLKNNCFCHYVWTSIVSCIIISLFTFSHSLFEALYNLSEGSLFLPITAHVFLNFLSNAKGLTPGMKVNPLLNLGYKRTSYLLLTCSYRLFSHFCETVLLGDVCVCPVLKYLFYLPKVAPEGLHDRVWRHNFPKNCSPVDCPPHNIYKAICVRTRFSPLPGWPFVYYLKNHPYYYFHIGNLFQGLIASVCHRSWRGPSRVSYSTWSPVLRLPKRCIWAIYWPLPFEKAPDFHLHIHFLSRNILPDQWHLVVTWMNKAVCSSQDNGWILTLSWHICKATELSFEWDLCMWGGVVSTKNQQETGILSNFFHGKPI